MTGFDYAFLGLACLSVLVGVWRGLISCIFALLGWLIALVAVWFGASAAGFLPIESESLRWLAAFALIFIVVLIVLAMFRVVLK